MTHIAKPSGWPQDLWEQVQEALNTCRGTHLRKAQKAVNSLEAGLRGPVLRVGLVSTFTIEPQLKAIELSLSACPCRAELVLADLDNLEGTLKDPDSPFHQQELDLVLVLWRLEDLLPRYCREGSGWSEEQRQAAVEALKTRLSHLIDSKLPLMVATLPSPSQRWLNSRWGPQRACLEVNREFWESPVKVFDLAAWAADFGQSAFDQRMDLFARQPLSNTAAGSFGWALRRAVRPLVQPRSKVLALDLDNVLWGGILEENEVSDLRLGHDHPGNVYQRIQLRAKALKEQGVLLVLLSKNDDDRVVEAFRTHPEMVLQLDDFAARRVNWTSKHLNLSEVAEELSLDPNSFVFVDDQPFERQEMRFHLPEVQVAEVSEEGLTILAFLEQTELFDSYEMSREDLTRAADYRAQSERKKLESTADSRQSFLTSLGLKARVAPVTEATLPRVVQMLGKTNQFNLTTRRHKEAEVRTFLKTPGALLLTLEVADNFSDQGIVGLAIALPQGETLHIDTFLLSCRALGRGAEQVLFSELVARTEGAEKLVGEFIPTARNAQVADLYARLGMTPMGERKFELELPARVDPPDWFEVEAERGKKIAIGRLG